MQSCMAELLSKLQVLSDEQDTNIIFGKFECIMKSIYRIGK